MSSPSRLGVRIARLPHGEGLPLPAPATPGSAGVDLAAAVPPDRPLVLESGARALVPTGFALAVPDGYEAQVRPRSGLALRHGILLPNAPGTIDSDYRGEVRVILWNAGPQPFTIHRGDRIAQLVLARVERPAWTEVGAEGLDDTERGAGGFGHTGSGAAGTKDAR